MADATWMGRAYRRFSVDMHVPDWHPDLLSRFDPERYVELIARGGFQSLVHYAKSHSGQCLWRTRLDRTHAAMGDRDWFGEVVEACRRRDVVPLAYFSVIHDNWVFESRPAWRYVRARGGPATDLETRYGLVCPNHEGYRAYVRSCVSEIAAAYDIDGMFFDMTFWPGVCLCASCIERYWRENGCEIPRVVDWQDAGWLAFQDARERWMGEFAALCTQAARDAHPGLTVNHQFSTVLSSWSLGVPLSLRDACDYVGGDFYGGPTQHSLACKVFDSLTPRRPFEFHTSRTRTVTDHVTAKTLEELRVESHVATLHAAALLFVDYINADGTLNPAVYDMLSAVNRERALYEPYLGGRLLADIAIYLDRHSLYDPAQNGRPLHADGIGAPGPHLDAAVGMARILQEAHLPYGVVTPMTLDRLSSYRAVLLPHVLTVTPKQADAFRRYVAEGGAVLVSGPPAGLEEILGVHATGMLGTRITYLTPVPGDPLEMAILPQDHVSFEGPMVEATIDDDATVAARVTLPFVPPESGQAVGSRFAAIHSHPPAPAPTRHPAAVIRTCGKGRAAWLTASFEVRREKANADLVRHLIGRIVDSPFAFELDAPAGVEATLFDHPERGCLRLGVLNLQPGTSVNRARARVRVPAGRAVGRVRHLPAGTAVAFAEADGAVVFEAGPIEVLRMFEIALR